MSSLSISQIFILHERLKILTHGICRMEFSVTNRVYIGFGILFLLSATIGMTSYYTIKKQEIINRSLNHTYQVMNAADDIQSLLTDMESSRRGLRCTHQRSYLEPYYRAQEQIGPAMIEIYRLTGTDSEQSARVSLMEKHINDIQLFWSKIRLDESKYD